MAKDVITRFKLETTGFDSKIKQAAKELSAYSKTATQAKEGFNQFTKANVDAAKALGTMATSTTNVKDRAKELVGAYNEAAKAYEALSDEHKQSDWAKALAGSLTQLQQRIKETKAEMQGLGDSMKGANDGSLLSKLGGKMDGALAVFGGNLMTKAAGMGVGLVTEMTDAVKQGIELAKAGEGVRIAFERLGRGDILQGLREATHGTVTDLELMKAAVKFNDFKLPVEELGTMLAFAQQKAKDTGQSVDYMVDSIVTGLGRKSLMILDNLGLSASEIRERMKETGDMTKAVGAIIREQMASAGEYVETAADRAAQANVSLQNKMEELGRKFAPVEEASNQLWTSIKIGILDIVGGPLATLLNQMTEAGRLKNAITNMNGGGNGVPTRVDRMISMLGDGQGSRARNTYNQQLKAFDDKIGQQKFRIASLSDNDAITRGLKQKAETELKALQALKSEYISRAKDIMQPVNFTVNTKQAEQNVASLRRQLKELEEQRKKAVKSGDQEQVENLTKQISQVKTNIGYLDPRANKTGSSTKTEQTELQKNQSKINELTQQFVDINAEASRAGKPLTEEQKKQTEEIQKQIEKLKERNGLLNRFAEQAQGRLLSNDDLKRKAEIDMQVNTKQIEDLRRQLTEIEQSTPSVNVDATHSPDFLGFSKGAAKPREAGGIGSSQKSVTITATDEALPKLREIEGITIDDKTMTVTAETADALRALQGIEGVTIDPKSVTITATDEAMPKLREIEGITIDDKTMTVTAETTDALRALQGIEGVTIDPKSVTITATDEALPKLREIEGITIDDNTMTVTAETADALRALQGIEGVTIDPKTIEVNANTSEAQQKIDGLKAKIAELEDKNINIKAFVESIGKPLGEGLNKTPGTLLKAPDTTIPRGGLQLDDKDMKAVRKNIDSSLPKAKGKDNPMDGTKKMLNAIMQLTSGLQQMGIELPAEIQGVISVIQGVTSVIEAVNTIIGITQASELTANTVAMGLLTEALWANTATSWIPFANGGIVPGFANGGVIDSGHSPAFLSFSKSAPAFATGGVVPQTITSIPRFNEGGTVEAGHAPDFLSFSKAMPKFETGGIIQKFNEGGTVEAGHAPDFLSFSKAMPRRFASGGTVPHAANGYFVGGSHFSGDVTPIMANAGELVLNKAQQGNLASQLQGGGIGDLNLTATIKGEQIRLALNNNGRRTGRGEYVQSRNVK